MKNLRRKGKGKILAVLLAVMLIVSCMPAGIAFGGPAPTITPHGGTITTSTPVGIDAVGQAVYYTITPGSSGRPPTVSDSVYSKPFIVSTTPGTFTVEAAVYDDTSGLIMISTDTDSATFTIAAAPANTLTFTPNGGSITPTTPISIGVDPALSTSEAVYYTTDGNDPTVGSSVYSQPFTLPAGNITVKAAVYDSSTGLWSSPASATFTVSTSAPTQNSTISPNTATFDKNTSGTDYADVTVTLVLNGNTFVDVKNGSATLTSGTDYTVSGSTVTISKSYLATQGVGTTDLTFDFSAGDPQTLAVTVEDTTPAPAPTVISISPTSGPTTGGTSVTITGTGLSTVTAVYFGSTAATSFAYYVGTGIMSAVSPAGTGTVDLTVYGYLGGTSAVVAADEFTYTIPSAQNSTISPNTATFDKNTSGTDYADVTVTLVLYGNTFVDVKNGSATLTSGTDYTVSGSTVTILKSYLANQSVGTTTLTFDFSAGASATLAVTVEDTTPAVVYTPTISPSSGAITTSDPVGIDATLSVGQAVYYTTDGNAPTVGSSVYSQPFTLPAGNITVKAAVYDSSTGLWSSIASATFTVTAPAPDTDATLSDLQVGGTTVTGFAPGTTTYNVVLPAGTTTVPTVTATVYDTGKATYVVTSAASLPGSTTVKVTAQDNATTQTYTINFTVLLLVAVTKANPTVTVTTGHPLQVTVPSDVTNAALKTSPVNGTVTMPQVSVQSSTSLGTVDVSIPNGTQVTGPSNWDGTINLPQVVANNSVTVTPDSGYTASVSAAIEIGLSNTALTFSQPVRILIPGQSGKYAGWVRNGVFTKITTLMSSDSAAALGANADGYLSVGNDLVIWTKHFTTFVAYTETAIHSGGGGGGSSSYTPTAQTKAATTVTATSAVLNGDITSDNGHDITEYGFLWGTSSSSLTNKLKVGTDNHSGAFTTTLGSLTAGTTYYFRVYATNSYGTANGAVMSFTTTGSSQTTTPTTPKTLVFSDIPATYWGYDAISSLSGKGIISGYPNGTFKPDASITRAEFATMLVKALGLDTSGTTGKFTDVTAGSWYYGSVNSAVTADLVSGTGDNLFAPNALITREQMAVMVTKALGNKAPTTDGTELNAFSDRSSVSSWAASGMTEAVKAGIISGMTAGTLAPTANATRAQAAVMIYKMLTILGK